MYDVDFVVESILGILQLLESVAILKAATKVSLPKLQPSTKRKVSFVIHRVDDLLEITIPSWGFVRFNLVEPVCHNNILCVLCKPVVEHL